MFIHVGKLIKLPQWIYPIRPTSLVGLKLLDNSLRSWVHAANPVLALLGFHASVENRELRESVIWFRQRTSMVRHREFVRQIVESGAEVVQAISADRTKRGRWWIKHLHLNLLLAAVRVEFGNVAVRSIQPIINSSIQDA
jgi:hypothetical protein